MKKLLTLISLLVLANLLTNCVDTCETTYTYHYYEPVYTSMEDIRKSVAFDKTEREINQSGKIYYIKNHLLINEPNEGIHIIDNNDPQNPDYIGFINIPGNFDMAAVQGYLYADSYMDLVVLDISDLSNPFEVDRMEDIFPNYNSYSYYPDPEYGVVTDWREVERVVNNKTDCEGNYGTYGWGYRYSGGIAVMESVSMDGGSAVSPSNPGVGGSMARFTITQNHLYMIDQSDMRVISLENPSSPMLGTQLSVGWGIETIFPYDSLLFIGANDGMSIWDVSTPLSPDRLSTYSHITSCDPVVTDGKYAYVTLRSGTQCAGFTNQLDVVDIQNPRDPKLVKTYPMYNPHGLSISNNRLFICDGDAGLKIYNAFDVNNIDKNLIKHFGDLHAYDVIVIGCLVMMIGDDGLKQYSCNDFQQPFTLLSHIPFNNESQ